jgi:hypothetical protein
MRTRFMALTATLLTLLWASPGFAAIYRVDLQDGNPSPGPGTGSTWGFGAFKYLQDALAVAAGTGS